MKSSHGTKAFILCLFIFLHAVCMGQGNSNNRDAHEGVVFPHGKSAFIVAAPKHFL